MSEQLPFYIFLVRHAARKRSWDVSESDHAMENWIYDDSKILELTAIPGKVGLPRTLSLAGSLCDQLELMKVTVNEIIHSEHLVAKQTAQLYQKLLQKRFESNVSVMSENSLYPVDNKELANHTRGLIKELLDKDRQPEKRQGLIVIGHQPSLTYIAKELLKPRRLPAGILPIGNSEIACIRLGENPALLWLLTEKSSEVSSDLKAKIASKFDVAKFILGALILNLGLYLSSDLWAANTQAEALLLGGAMIFAFLAFGFTIATLFAYDRLNMPNEFWGSDGKPDATPRPWRVNRPPSSYQLILFFEMIHVWKSFFIPAILFATISLGLLVVKLAYSHFVWPNVDAGIMSIIMSGIILLGLIVSMVIYQIFKPKLGFDD